MIHSDRKKISAFFSQTAREYKIYYEDARSLRALVFKSRKEIVLDMVRHHGRGGDLLDLGCGPGIFTREIKALGYSYMGVDISHEMVSLGKKFFPDAEFAVGSIENLTFSENRFDIIICIGVLDYLKDDYTIIERIPEILRAGGLLIITGSNKKNIGRIFRRIARFIYKKIIFTNSSKNTKKVFTSDISERDINIKQFIFKLRRVNLELLEIRYFNFTNICFDLPLTHFLYKIISYLERCILKIIPFSILGPGFVLVVRKARNEQ